MALTPPVMLFLASMASTSEPIHGVIYVPVDGDRFARRRNVFGFLPIDIKLSGADTSGGLLLLEQIDDRKGGPPKHVHPAQDEWFHVVQGAYVVVIDERRHSLGAGDSLLAPRGVPHVGAHVGETTGRMLIAFTPAGVMEEFFAEATRLTAIPSREQLGPLFHRHGMELLGPPLSIE